jgi:hypothetical protein
VGDDEVETGAIVGFVAAFAGADVGAWLEGVVLVEVARPPVALRLLRVLQEEFTLETGQIVHQYNYYPAGREMEAGGGGRGVSNLGYCGGLSRYFGR